MQEDKNTKVFSRTDAEIKELLKQALLELLDERLDVWEDLFAEVLENLALASAIRDGLSFEMVDRAKVIQTLEERHRPYHAISGEDDYLAMLRTDLQYLDLAGLAPRVQNRVVKISLEDVFIPLNARPEVTRRRSLPSEMLRLLAAGELQAEGDITFEGRADLDGELAALVDEFHDRSTLAARLAERGYHVPGYERGALDEVPDAYSRGRAAEGVRRLSPIVRAMSCS